MVRTQCSKCQGPGVQPLAKELRHCKPHTAAIKKSPSEWVLSKAADTGHLTTICSSILTPDYSHNGPGTMPYLSLGLQVQHMLDEGTSHLSSYWTVGSLTAEIQSHNNVEQALESWKSKCVNILSPWLDDNPPGLRDQLALLWFPRVQYTASHIEPLKKNFFDSIMWHVES